MNDQIYQQARLRFTIPLFILASLLPAFIEYQLFSDYLILEDDSIASLSLFLSGYVIIFGVFWLCWCRSHSLHDSFGQPPLAKTRRHLYSLVPPLIAISFLGLYLLFYPLSVIYPSVVEDWILDVPEILRAMDDAGDIRYNLANVVAVVLLAPVAEEFFFRGFLLGRMQRKFGVKVAIIFSSVLFALLHGEILGSFIFAVFMCLIRYQYQSLFAPIMVHMANNFLVTMIVFIDQILLQHHYNYTVEEFQSYWWLALIGLFYGVPALFQYYQRHLSQVMMQVKVDA